jgi:asparagine synthase (glutamine-hydrolysing)
MSMASGVELRVPFLDHRLVECVVALPPWQKLQAGRQKALLVDAMPEIAPLATAGKEGFDLPLHAWLRGWLRAPVEERLRSAPDATRVGLASCAVERVWRRFVRRGDPPSAHRVWALYALMTWARMHRMVV